MEIKKSSEDYKQDVRALLDEVAKVDNGQKADISNIIDKLRDKSNKYDLSFLTRNERDFVLELIVVHQLIFKKSERIPKLIDAYLDLSKSVDGQFIKTISDLYRIENKTDMVMPEMPANMIRRRRW